MKILFRQFLILCLAFFSFSISAQNIRCKLKGTVIGRDSKTLIIKPETEDQIRFDGIEVKITDHHFEYNLEVPVIQRYNLIFKDEFETGAWMPVAFFPENGTIEFTLHTTNEFNRNITSGGTLNKTKAEFEHLRDSLFNPLYKPYSSLRDSLWNTKEYYSEQGNDLYDRIRSATDYGERSKLYIEKDKLEKSGLLYSSKVDFVNTKIDSIGRVQMYWTDDYIRDHTDLFSYSLIYFELDNYKTQAKTTDVTFLNEIYPRFFKKYPSHPYTKRVGEMLNAINKIRIGSHYIDFEAPTVEGKLIRISDSIEGKVALIDLWASWCGPCRGLNKRMIPVYEKYKSRGFKIFGVACEYKSDHAFRTAVADDKYPWLNLLELNNRNSIWSKYNIAGSGGSTYLVDKNGIIVAIHPDAEELDSLLKEYCK